MPSKITKQDIENFRALAKLILGHHAALARIEKKLNRRFISTDNWADELSGLPLETDEDVIFAMGVICYVDE